MTIRLLAHLVHEFSSNRREDLATEALAHVLRQSPAARRALESLTTAVGVDANLVRFSTQQADAASASRPDLAAYDTDGNLQLLIEAKFGAGLTSNQPHEYLRQTDGAVLVVAPARRLETLWPELRRRAEQLGPLEVEVRAGDTRWSRVDRRVTLALTSWRGLLDPIMTAVAAQDAGTLGDVEQLVALCDVFESEAFVPFTSEELTGEFGRRFMELIQIVDDLTARLLTFADVNKNGLRATPGRGWYGQYLNFAGAATCLFVDADRWGKSGLTPLWFTVKSGFGTQHDPDLVEQALSPLWRTVNQPRLREGTWEVPLNVPIGTDRDSVLEALLAQLTRIAELLRATPALAERLAASIPVNRGE